MASYVAFLRAINLGTRRQFPAAAVAAAAEAAGFTDVATHLNTGNLRFSSPGRSLAKLEATLEAAFATDRGFEVPTVVLRAADLVALAAEADGWQHPGQHYVSLLKREPDAQALAGLEALSTAAEQARASGVQPRAVHLLLGADYHRARLTNAVVEKHLGVATNRNLTVIRALADRWGGG